MKMMELAWMNMKSSIRSYLSLIVSLAFTILIFYNFQNIIYAETFAVLGTQNKEYIDIIIQVILFVLGCFMFFFLWYATNVFLTRRKKEIGVYIFMGLSNRRIGTLYMIETVLTGLAALFLGLSVGVLSGTLFQMIFAVISEYQVTIGFGLEAKPVLITAAVYLVMYLFFAVKGYLEIVRSSVLEMISAARKNEYVRQRSWLLLAKAILGVGVLGTGYYLAVRKGGMEVLANALAAVILVVAGTYLLFGGLIPLIFQNLARNKIWLYRRQRSLWVNQMIFRMKKNYRTYAMVSVLMLCAVTALATGFAMRVRYQNMIRFDNTFTFQIMSDRDDLDGRARELITGQNVITASSKAEVLAMDGSKITASEHYNWYLILSYPQFDAMAKESGMENDLPEPADGEVIAASHLVMLSLVTDQSDMRIQICGQEYRQIAKTTTPYLGYLQKEMSVYVVSEADYERLLPYGDRRYVCNYRIGDTGAFAQTKDALDLLRAEYPDNWIGRIAVDPESAELAWTRVIYTICLFLFLVFVLAGGCIMFMKFYNDACEEKGRYQVLAKLGFSCRTLKRSVKAELFVSCLLPFLVMGISSYFSVHALENVMFEDLTRINLVSVLVTMAVFAACYLLSVPVYLKNAGVTVRQQARRRSEIL
ncbi:MAG: ABC transporter permease [Roseburia sp.]|jgi:putative ABC transport system permease protein|nr:ABC transporter permease [Roseburia sp.]